MRTGHAIVGAMLILAVSSACSENAVNPTKDEPQPIRLHEDCTLNSECPNGGECVNTSGWGSYCSYACTAHEDCGCVPGTTLDDIATGACDSFCNGTECVETCPDNQCIRGDCIGVIEAPAQVRYCRVEAAGGAGGGAGSGGAGGSGGTAGSGGTGSTCTSISGTYSGSRTRNSTTPGSCPPDYYYNPNLPCRVTADPASPSGFMYEIGYTNSESGEIVFTECTTNVAGCSLFATCLLGSGGTDQVTITFNSNSYTGTLDRQTDTGCTVNFDLSGLRQ
jgi:hypothetical protein